MCSFRTWSYFINAFETVRSILSHVHCAPKVGSYTFSTFLCRKIFALYIRFDKAHDCRHSTSNMFAPQPAACTTGRSAFVKSNLVIPCAMQAAIKTEHPGKNPSSDQLRIFIKETTYTATPLRFDPCAVPYTLTLSYSAAQRSAPLRAFMFCWQSACCHCWRRDDGVTSV